MSLSEQLWRHFDQCVLFSVAIFERFLCFFCCQEDTILSFGAVYFPLCTIQDIYVYIDLANQN